MQLSSVLVRWHNRIRGRPALGGLGLAVRCAFLYARVGSLQQSCVCKKCCMRARCSAGVGICFAARGAGVQHVQWAVCHL